MDEESRKLDEKRKKLLKEEKICILLFIVILSAIIFYGTMKDYDSTFAPITILLIISFFVIQFWGYKIMSKHFYLIKCLKEDVTNSLYKTITNFDFKPNRGIYQGLYRKSNFIDKYDEYNVKNFIGGKLEDHTNFQICDLLLSKIYKDSNGNAHKNILFNGIFGVLDSEEIHDFTIRINPDINNKYINHIAAGMRKMVGIKNTVRLENSEFERYFEVYSDNQIEARKILTIEFMEKLLILRKKLNKEITIIYKEGKIFFFIRRGKLIDEKALMRKGVCSEIKKCTYDNIKLLIETMNLLH